VTTYDQLLDRIIADGLAEVRVAYADPKDHHKRDGAIEGFEACRGKLPDEIVALWTEVEKECAKIRAESITGDDHLRRYWKSRYKVLQIEFVLNVISVGLKTSLLSHLPTYRGAMKYAEIVGVRRDEAETS
jgi:hypothetical protein